MEALQGLTGSADIVWRPSVEMLKEEGWAVDQHGAGTGHSVASSQGGAPAGQAVEAVAGGEDADGGGGGVGGAGGGGDQAQVVVLENGVKYAAAPLGQKTGFYADQRDSRAALRALAAGRRVLDLCCYSGGFAINAALGGATEVGARGRARRVAAGPGAGCCCWGAGSRVGSQAAGWGSAALRSAPPDPPKCTTPCPPPGRR